MLAKALNSQDKRELKIVLQRVWTAPKKQVKNGAKTVVINVVGSRPKPQR